MSSNKEQTSTENNKYENETDYIDEFTLSILGEYDGHKFVNVANENLDLEIANLIIEIDKLKKEINK